MAYNPDYTAAFAVGSETPDKIIQSAIDKIWRSGERSDEMGRVIVALHHAKTLIVVHDAKRAGHIDSAYTVKRLDV
jgi:hypothetical protein